MAVLKRGKKEEEKVLDIDASMQGNLVFKDPVTLRIQGKFEGRLETRGVLIIGENAEVKADIVGEEMIVAGKVNGTLTATKEVRIIPPAKVKAELKSPLLHIERGAIFNGLCQMPSETTNSKSIFSLEEMANYLSVDIASLTSWAEQGKIPAFREANTWKFEKTKIDEWISAGKLT
ncbi:MAG: polymer-forming cytoskeletal protein [Candidatus Omnitrophica bacterium]|nr:polymer-forming cytoskeletal protein [Candidatus Omnitrophota bacterium]MCM8793692.1 polymer-forming cytoskeletal protein [Candidatus Omnitrophota bacterium]